MKILHVSSAKTWRGGEQQIIYLFEELQGLGLQQWIFCVEGSAIATYCKKNNLAHHTYKKRFAANPLIALQIKQLSQKKNIDLIHLHDAHSHTFAFMSALLGNPKPMVLSRRVDFPVRSTWLSHKKYNHPSIKKIISVSAYVQSILAPAIEAQQKLISIHSGIDLHRFKYPKGNLLRQTYHISPNIKLIGNVAAIAPHKDYFTFVDTAAHLLEHHKALKFFIIGADAGEKELITQYIETKKLNDYFIFTGFRNDIPQILPELDVFLFTSKEEGLGTSVLDALACGVPVVATQAGGIPELIQDGKNGLLAPIKAAERLAEQVTHILENPKLKEQLIKNGKQTARSFSKQVMASKTYRVYKEVLGM
jgi:glycosyltransferase involved in cell wall biosynthesis